MKGPDGTKRVTGSNLLTILVAEEELIRTGIKTRQLRDMVRLQEQITFQGD